MFQLPDQLIFIIQFCKIYWSIIIFKILNTNKKKTSKVDMCSTIIVSSK